MCLYATVCKVCEQSVRVCVLLGRGGSIRGSGHAAHTQVIEGKQREELLEVGAVREEEWGGGAHVWL